MNYATELVDWIRTLDPSFAFLLAIPFAVAGAALLHDWVEKFDSRPRTSGRPATRT